MTENEYYTQAFRHIRAEGFVYEGGGTYAKNGSRVRVRTFVEWTTSPAGGYMTPEESSHAA